MKQTVLFFYTLAIQVCLAGNPVSPAGPTDDSLNLNIPFDHFLSLPYSPVLGLSLYETGVLLEARTVPALLRPDGEPANPRLWGLTSPVSKRLWDPEKFRKQAIASAKQNNILWTDDYAELGIGSKLAFEDRDHDGDGDGSAILLRIRESFQMLNEETNGAEFLYVDDRDNGAAGMVKGAIMLDIYLDALYNQPWWKKSLIIRRPYQFWMRTGFEVDYNTLSPEAESDTRRFFALVNFQANPDQNANLLFIPGMSVTSPQIIQLGGVLEQNELTGEESLNWIVGWQPQFELTRELAGSFGRGFGLNKKMPYRSGAGPFALLKEVSPEGLAAMEDYSGIYSFINPSFNIEAESTARLAGQAATTKAEADFAKEILSWKLTSGFGFGNGKFVASWESAGIHPVTDLGKSHIGHEARLSMNLAKMFDGKSRGMETTNAWAGLTAYAAWRTGEWAPTFQDVDQLIVGATLRF